MLYKDANANKWNKTNQNYLIKTMSLEKKYEKHEEHSNLNLIIGNPTHSRYDWTKPIDKDQ